MTFDQLQPVTVGDLTFDVRTLGPDDGEPVHAAARLPRDVAELVGRRAGAGRRRLPGHRTRPAWLLPRRPTRLPSPTTRWSTSSTTSWAWPTPSASTRSISSATTGARRSAGRSLLTTATGCAPSPRCPCRTSPLTTAALRSDSDQQERSSYIGLMREEGKAEDVLAEDDGRRLRAMYDGKIPADPRRRLRRLLPRPRGAHRCARLVPRDDGGARRPAVGVGAHDVRVERRRLGHRTRLGRGCPST